MTLSAITWEKLPSQVPLNGILTATWVAFIVTWHILALRVEDGGWRRSRWPRQSQAALSDFRRGIPEARPETGFLDTIDATLGVLIDSECQEKMTRKMGVLGFHIA